MYNIEKVKELNIDGNHDDMNRDHTDLASSCATRQTGVLAVIATHGGHTRVDLVVQLQREYWSQHLDVDSRSVIQQ